MTSREGFEAQARKIIQEIDWTGPTNRDLNLVCDALIAAEAATVERCAEMCDKTADKYRTHRYISRRFRDQAAALRELKGKG